MSNYQPDSLGAIKIYVDNRIKYGSMLPTKDGKNYRCSKETLAKLKVEIRKRYGDKHLENRLALAALYRPTILARNPTKAVL